MSDIFISYSSKDRKKTRILAKILESKGWNVWWDKKIAPGKAFDKAISNALDSARCIIVLWSEHSIKSDWVMEEAHEGMQRKILLPTKIDAVKLPFGFRRLQTINLSRWRGGTDSQNIKKLLDTVELQLKSTLKPSKPKKSTTSKTNKQKKTRTRKLTGALDGKTIVFTGALSESRNAHAEKVRAVGANFVNSVSSNTDYLVVGKNPGDVKLEGAKKHSVKKITERQWLKILNEAYARILRGKTIVFTGDLSAPKSEFKTKAKKLKAKPARWISEETNYLVTGKNTPKRRLAKAKKCNVDIITEAVWNDIVHTLKV